MIVRWLVIYMNSNIVPSDTSAKKKIFPKENSFSEGVLLSMFNSFFRFRD